MIARDVVWPGKITVTRQSRVTNGKSVFQSLHLQKEMYLLVGVSINL